LGALSNHASVAVTPITIAVKTYRIRVGETQSLPTSGVVLPGWRYIRPDPFLQIALSRKKPPVDSQRVARTRPRALASFRRRHVAFTHKCPCQCRDFTPAAATL
jgi:hypothetical protein